MKEGWEIKSFEDCIEKVCYSNKIKKNRFKESGNFPIISQEVDFINGYWDKEEDLFKLRKPVVIFGDHTKIFKFVDFNFVIGADGIKILETNNQIDPKYFYYYLQSVKLKDLGYARHYRLLKEKKIKFPSVLSEQKRIVSVLEKAFDAIEKAKANAEENLENSKEIFESYLNNIFVNKGEDWEEKRLAEVVDFERGLTYSKKDEVDFSENIVLRANNVDLFTRKLDFTELKYIDPKIKIPENKKLKKGSLIICTASGSKRHLGKVALIDADYDYAFGGFMGLITPKKEINSDFIFYLLVSDIYREFIDGLSDGVNINNLKFSDLGSFLIPLPPQHQQRLIAQELKNLSTQTQSLEKIYQKKLKYLEEMKKSLLHKAFKGEL